MRSSSAKFSSKRDPHIFAASIAANILAFAMPLFLLQVYDRIIPNQGVETLFVIGGGVVIAIILEMILRTARAYLMGLAGDNYERKMQNLVFEKLLKSDLAQVEAEAPGVHLDRIADIDKAREYKNGDAALAVLDLPFVAVFLVVMIIVSPLIAAVVAVMLVASVLIVRAMQSHAVELSEKKHDVDRRRFSFLIEVLDSIESIKSFNLEAFMERRYERLMSSSAKLTAETVRRSNFAQSVTGAVGQITPFVVAATGASLVIQGNLSVGALAAAILLASRVVQPVMRLTAFQASDGENRRAEQQLNEFLATPHHSTGELACQRLNHMSLVNVGFKPEEGQPAIFENINLSFARGETICLDGQSGSGRSSILWMMTGYLRPNSGHIEVNGHNLDTINEIQLRDRIAYLPQRNNLIEGTVLENMTRFQPEKYLDDALRVATSLGLDDYFAKHPEGLNTQVGRGRDAGLPVSIAERIPLVGALVGNPDLVIFDEANTNLDAEGDNRLREHLASLKGHAALIMVTQRPSYANMADRTYKIENGRITNVVQSTVSVEPASNQLGAAS